MQPTSAATISRLADTDEADTDAVIFASFLQMWKWRQNRKTIFLAFSMASHDGVSNTRKEISGEGHDHKIQNPMEYRVSALAPFPLKFGKHSEKAATATRRTSRHSEALTESAAPSSMTEQNVELMEAVEEGNMDQVKILLERKASLDMAASPCTHDISEPWIRRL